MDEKTLFTIGYPRYTIKDFLSTLKENGINALVDVRAFPHISHFEVYRRNNIKKELEKESIVYKFFGKLLGARPDNPEYYTNGKVDYEKIKKASEFQDICENIKLGLDKGNTICLMCAQNDPIICHRSILITDYFRYTYPETSSTHLMPGTCESQQELDCRLLGLYMKKHRQTSLFSTEDNPGKTMLEKAYIWQGQQIAYEADC